MGPAAVTPMKAATHIAPKQHGTVLTLLLCLLCLHGSRLHAQVMDVPISLQVPLAIKALSYSKTLPGKLINGKLVIGIVFQEKYRRSLMQMEELVDALGREKPSYPIQVQRIPVDEAGLPTQSVNWKGLSCVYFTTMRATTPAPVLQSTRPYHIISFSTEAKAALTHVTMAFELVGGRAKIAINRGLSDQERCEFSSQLLKLAVIY